MRGRIGIVIGLAAGYVLGARAGRERYEQIKEQAENLWNTEPVQKQVDKVKDFGKTAAAALPNAVWNGAVKVTDAVRGKGTAGDKLDAAVKAGKDSAKDIAKGARTTADEVDDAAKNTASKVGDAAKNTANEVGDSAEDAFEDVQKAAREHDGN